MRPNGGRDSDLESFTTSRHAAWDALYVQYKSCFPYVMNNCFVLGTVVAVLSVFFILCSDEQPAAAGPVQRARADPCHGL